MNTIKKWYQSKAIWYGILNALVGVTAFIAANPKLGIAATLNGILVVVLRTYANSPIDGTKAAAQARIRTALNK